MSIRRHGSTGGYKSHRLTGLAEGVGPGDIQKNRWTEAVDLKSARLPGDTGTPQRNLLFFASCLASGFKTDGQAPLCGPALQVLDVRNGIFFEVAIDTRAMVTNLRCLENK